MLTTKLACLAGFFFTTSFTLAVLLVRAQIRICDLEDDVEELERDVIDIVKDEEKF